MKSPQVSLVRPQKLGHGGTRHIHVGSWSAMDKNAFASPHWAFLQEKKSHLWLLDFFKHLYRN